MALKKGKTQGNGGHSEQYNPPPNTAGWSHFSPVVGDPSSMQQNQRPGVQDWRVGAAAANPTGTAVERAHGNGGATDSSQLLAPGAAPMEVSAPSPFAAAAPTSPEPAFQFGVATAGSTAVPFNGAANYNAQAGQAFPSNPNTGHEEDQGPLQYPDAFGATTLGSDPLTASKLGAATEHPKQAAVSLIRCGCP